jgi:Ni/Co efflux regulator RcnB
MKTAVIAAAILAIAAPAATQAFAGHEGAIIKIDDKGKHKGKYKKHKNKGWDDDRSEHRAYREGYQEGRRDERYRQSYGGYSQQHYQPGGVRYGYQRGYYLPQEYRGYVIRDYHEYDLYQPQYGQQWVGAGQNAYLVEAATGLILQVLQGRYR